MTRRPRLLLADDHPLFLEGVRRFLENKYEVVGTVADGQALITAAQQLRPDVIVVDISMPEMNGLAAAQILGKTVPSAKFIVLSVHSDQAYVSEAFRVGVKGYVSKRAAAAELLTAIKQVLEGRTYVTPLVALNTPVAAKDAKRLTLRQLEILRLVAEGYQNKEIAQLLKISVKTVEFHKTRIMSELDIHTPAGLTRYAIDHGIAAA
ncbi:MAG: Response regulator, LuxR family [Bryobacterales bacterium]|jgi:DNA-binding NarL/FixJ family response regulator|nr:Response regulator, LuxR family [Bryobacterales bacterium]